MNVVANDLLIFIKFMTIGTMVAISPFIVAHGWDFIKEVAKHCYVSDLERQGIKYKRKADGRIAVYRGVEAK